MYKKVLLAYDGSVEGRRALREGAKLAQLCRSEVFLLAVVEVSSIMTPEAGLTIPIELQTEDYKAILNEGCERLKAVGFTPTARLEVGDAGQKIAEVAEEIGAHLVVVGHRPQGTLARWFGSIGSYLVKRLRCSVLVGPDRDQRRRIRAAEAGGNGGLDGQAKQLSRLRLRGNDHLADRPQRDAGKFQVRPGKGNADDGHGQQHGRDDVAERQPPSRQHQPDDVADHPERAGADIFLPV